MIFLPSRLPVTLFGLRAAAVALLCLGCSSNQPRPFERTREDRPVQIPSPSSLATTAPSARPPPAALSLPAVPPGTEGPDARTAYLQHLCAPVQRRARDGHIIVGCPCCPPFDECAPNAA